jgi:hypothetical protein
MEVNMSINSISTFNPASPLGLPEEIFEKIVSYVEPKEVGKTASVSKAWDSTLKKDLTSFPIEIGRNQTTYSRDVVAEILTTRYPKALVKALNKTQTQISKFAQDTSEAHVHRSIKPDEMRVPLEIIRSEDGEQEKFVFRVKGESHNLTRMFDHWTHLQNIDGVGAIFRNANRFQLSMVDADDPHRSASCSSAGAIDYSVLEGMLKNPISLIWLYCNGDAPYVDLTQFIPVPNHTINLY